VGGGSPSLSRKKDLGRRVMTRKGKRTKGKGLGGGGVQKA